MCGIAGFFTPNQRIGSNSEFIIQRMVDSLSHRGPDDFGVWLDKNKSIALGHRRLAIVDTSQGGHQPMLSASGRYVLIFNGEIYNHKAIRHELNACGSVQGNSVNWRSESDTETLIEAIDAWGVDEALKECVGMFAIAVWDLHEETLVIARDRFGEKPLYYCWLNGVFIFASEIKAMREHPAFSHVVDRNALNLQLSLSYIPAPYSIYEGVKKLPAGTWLKVDMKAGGTQRDPIRYWSIEDVAINGQSNPFVGTESDALNALESILTESIRGQMISDVPLGAFLSGGIDSSLITAVMQKLSPTPIKTFSIGFDEKSHDEAAHAKSVAKYLGTDHVELYVSPKEMLAVIPRLHSVFDEPFADSSQIPTILLAELTRNSVKVALSGDGGDELFGGYNRYTKGIGIYNKFNRVPMAVKALLAKLMTLSSDGLLALLGDKLPLGRSSENLRKILDVITSVDEYMVYQRLVSPWHHKQSLVIGGSMPDFNLTRQCGWPSLESFEHRMMLFDAMTYLCDDILVKVDRACMAASLETRAPFLDHRLAEFAWKLPLHLKIRDGRGKYLLRELLYKSVPAKLVARPKKGFSVPLSSWLRGPLRDWAESLLDESRIRREHYFDPVQVRKIWRQCLAGRSGSHFRVWNILMFQSWLEGQVN